MPSCFINKIVFMNKQTIIRFLNGELGETEKDALFTWIEASDENRRYFNTVKNLWTASIIDRPANVRPDFIGLRQLIVSSRRRRTLGYYALRAAAAVALPLAVGLAWLIADRNRTVEPMSQTDYPLVSVYTPLCARSEVMLPDGTKVWLNSGSKLTYPRMFEGAVREVILDGEGFFDVVKNRDHPFVVRTVDKIDVQVKGTVFNLSAYAGESAELTLVEGAVDLSREDTGRKIAVRPRESVRVGDEGFEVRRNVNTDMYTGWKDGTLAFDDISMREMARRLERWYGVTIVIEDDGLLDFKYTGRFREETIGQVLDLIRQTSWIDYRMEDKTVYLSRKK